MVFCTFFAQFDMVILKPLGGAQGPPLTPIGSHRSYSSPKGHSRLLGGLISLIAVNTYGVLSA